ncbi:MAG: hypothetical protein KC517_09255 [Bacteroidetes bacterium]|nr:hypothetical protein [Bacteroidota bacterium]
MIEIFIYVSCGIGVSMVARLAYDGSRWGKRPLSAYVKKEYCQNNVDAITADVKSLRQDMLKSNAIIQDRVSEANTGIAWLRGHLEGKGI